MNKEDQKCLDIYMSVHSSQLCSVCDDTRRKWVRGQEIYCLQIQAGERVALLNNE